jgi:predicted  nucleic acid-binding Zn-ribbon protein
MKHPQTPSEPSGEDNEISEFENELLELERSLFVLKDRFIQVETDQEFQAELQERIQELKKNHPEMKVELKLIRQQLEVLEINLESRLFTWRSVKQPFWQVVRFGGLGVILGWLLKASTG